MMRREIGADKVEVFFLSKMKFAKINSAVNNNVKKVVLQSTSIAQVFILTVSFYPSPHMRVSLPSFSLEYTTAQQFKAL